MQTKADTLKTWGEFIGEVARMQLTQFTGCMMGQAIGDSLGVPREGAFNIAEVREISAHYTDDAAMMIGIAESLVQCRGLDDHHLARQFMENYEREPWRGYGGGPPRIFRQMRRGANWEEELDKEMYPGGSYGNGSAMRVAPIGLFYHHSSPEELREAARRTSRITHSHPLAVEGAALEAYAVSLALRREENFLEKLRGFTQEEWYLEKLKKMEKLLASQEDKNRVVRELGNGIEAYNSVPTAIFSFLAQDDFEEALVYAVSLGGDADTIGAMCGAVAGAWWGEEGIPQRWKENLENRGYIESLARQLWEFHLKG